MKNILVIALSLLTLAGCGHKEEKDLFTVKGKIKGLTTSRVILEEVPMATMQRVPIDSVAPDKDGNFTLKAATKEQSVYNLRLAGQEYPAASLINDVATANLELIYDPKQPQFPDRYEVKGSVASKKLHDYMLQFNKGLQQVFVLSKQLDSLHQQPVLVDSLVKVFQDQLSQKRQTLRTTTDRFMQDSQFPALTMMVLGYYQSIANNPAFGLSGYSEEEVTTLVNKLVTTNPGHKGLEAIQAMLMHKLPENQTASFVGQSAPDFSLPDHAGKMIPLNSFRGKFVLVDFWASWCRPCREENPHVVAAFAKYKKRNFTILGVSLDDADGKEKWQQAIMKDNLTWTQVSELKGWESQVVPLYRIQGIPFNVLIDPQGKIIAESLRGAQLDAMLEKVLPR